MTVAAGAGDGAGFGGVVGQRPNGGDRSGRSVAGRVRVLGLGQGPIGARHEAGESLVQIGDELDEQVLDLIVDEVVLVVADHAPAGRRSVEDHGDGDREVGPGHGVVDPDGRGALEVAGQAGEEASLEGRRPVPEAMIAVP